VLRVKTITFVYQPPNEERNSSVADWSHIRMPKHDHDDHGDLPKCENSALNTICQSLQDDCQEPL